MSSGIRGEEASPLVSLAMEYVVAGVFLTNKGDLQMTEPQAKVAPQLNMQPNMRVFPRAESAAFDLVVIPHFLSLDQLSYCH